MLYYSELFTFCTICSSFIFPWLERRRTSWSCLAKNATKKWKLQHINHLATFTISLSHTHAHPHAFFKHTHTLLSSFPWSLLAASLLLLSTHLCQAFRALHQIFFQHTHAHALTHTRTHTHTHTHTCSQQQTLTDSKPSRLFALFSFIRFFSLSSCASNKKIEVGYPSCCCCCRERRRWRPIFLQRKEVWETVLEFL